MRTTRKIHQPSPSDAVAAREPGARAKKRARGFEFEERAAGQAAPPRAPLSFESLSDAILSHVFNVLGPQASWPLRGVCRRWRRVIVGTGWGRFDLRIKGSLSATRMHRTVSALIEAGKLQLLGGASFSLRCELTQVRKDPLSPAAPQRPHAAAARDLRASEGAGDEQRQPRGRGRRREAPSARALAPPDGAAVALEALSVGIHAAIPSMRPWPTRAELRAALAPYAGLRSLDLFAGDVERGVGPEIAAVIAAACPLLRAVSLRPGDRSVPAVMAALASLPHLEELVLLAPAAPFDATRGVAALADGAAGGSLRRLALLLAPGRTAKLELHGEFPRRSAGACPALAGLRNPGLLALARMPKLESLEPLQLCVGEIAPAALLALGRAGALREVSVHVTGMHSDGEEEEMEDRPGPAAASALLRAHAETISSLPRLSRLALDLEGPASLSPADVAALLSCAGARRALASLDLSLDRTLTEADAEAILALPALRRLRVSSELASPPAASVRPFEVLQKLPPGVELEVDLSAGRGTGQSAFEEAEDAVEGLLAARLLARP
eukprot:tig00020553_g10683.t1